MRLTIVTLLEAFPGVVLFVTAGFLAGFVLLLLFEFELDTE